MSPYRKEVSRLLRLREFLVAGNQAGELNLKGCGEVPFSRIVFVKPEIDPVVLTRRLLPDSRNQYDEEGRPKDENLRTVFDCLEVEPYFDQGLLTLHFQNREPSLVIFAGKTPFYSIGAGETGEYFLYSCPRQVGLAMMLIDLEVVKEAEERGIIIASPPTIWEDRPRRVIAAAFSSQRMRGLGLPSLGLKDRVLLPVNKPLLLSGIFTRLKDKSFEEQPIAVVYG
jgi:hypothetical protein